ncbi:diiron oxygenase [Corallococcus exercitus]|uniref:diiron oxygenase n=1 Tax=Corallococcus exercitus TaxID=2316736 RepID=UPI0035D4AFB3
MNPTPATTPHSTRDAAVELAILDKIASTWQRRATVKKPELDLEGLFQPELPDYPIALVPFRDHPRFVEAPEERKQALLSWAWMAYNRNTIMNEEKIANPAFELLMHARFPGTNHPGIKRTVVQALVDENYHTFMHLNATLVTERKRGLVFNESLLPDSLACRMLQAARARAADAWEQDLLTLAYAVVAEISINAYLNLLSKDQSIQPINRMTTELHNRDEFSHALVIAEIAKSVYVHMNDAMRECFIRALPEALRGIASSDYKTWRALLEHLGFEHVDEIIGDLEGQTGSRVLVRDYSGLKHLASELGILERMDFEFA